VNLVLFATIQSICKLSFGQKDGIRVCGPVILAQLAGVNVPPAEWSPLKINHCLTFLDELQEIE